jgi:hypothetical protein
MKLKEQEALAEAMAMVLNPILKSNKAALVGLEKRIAQLEAKPTIKYCGTWTDGATYEKGDGVTHHGALWICKAQTAAEPSKDFAGWQLAVKKGQA